MTINIVCYFLFIFLVTFPSIAATSVTITSIVPNTLKVGQTQPWIVYTLVTSGVGAISEEDVLNEKVVLSVMPAKELPALSSKAVASIFT